MNSTLDETTTDTALFYQFLHYCLISAVTAGSAIFHFKVHTQV